VDKAYKYTLIHLEKRLRENSIRKFLAFMETKHNILIQEICGYSCVDAPTSRTESNDIHVHPLYRVIIAHKNEDNPNFESWTKLNLPTSGGLLKRHNVNNQGMLIRKSKPKPSSKRPRKEMEASTGDVESKSEKELALEAKIRKLTAEIKSKNHEIHDLKDTIKTNEDAAGLLSDRNTLAKTELELHNKKLTEDLAKSNTSRIAAEDVIGSLQSEMKLLKADNERLVRNARSQRITGGVYDMLDFQEMFNKEKTKCDQLKMQLEEERRKK